ncbi:MAG TPA: peptidylprolyl isomerase [Pseudomonadales bacterium]|nr:peptidylprolyl isomerase [Pseudomonadales bacterium]
MQIVKDTVVTFHYVLAEQGGDFSENSRDEEPVAYLYGHDNVLPGLESAMLGKQSGDSVSVTLTPELAYGLRNPELQQRMSIKHLKFNGKLKAGDIAWVETQEGPRQVTVIKPGKFMAEVDTNHPLSGKTLKFDIEIVSVRSATEDEIAHGHAHGAGGHHHD